MKKKKGSQKKTANKRVMQKILNTQAIKDDLIANKPKPEIYEEPVDEDAVFKVLANMKHRDMQRMCIEKGMGFEDVVRLDHQDIIAWIFRHWHNTEDPNKLKEFDNWQDSELAKKYDVNSPIRNPILKFSPIELPRTKLLDAPKPTEPKAEKKPVQGKHEEWGIKMGTKKYLTYELTIDKKLPLDKITDEVLKQFPEADVKSIKIWVGRAQKLLRGE